MILQLLTLTASVARESCEVRPSFTSPRSCYSIQTVVNAAGLFPSIDEIYPRNLISFPCIYQEGIRGINNPNHQPNPLGDLPALAWRPWAMLEPYMYGRSS